jgi:hypothetical protein
MDFTPYYRTSPNKSVDEDCADIVAGLKDIIENDRRVTFRLVNYFKGLPLSYPATLVEMSKGGTLELDVHKQQAVALGLNGYAFIKCDYFNKSILAEAQNVNVRNMTASLRNFCFVQIMAENRNSLRLELDPQTDAEMTWEDVVTTGKVIELSLGGFSIRSQGRCPVPVGAEVSLRVMVPNLLQNTLNRLDTKGKLVRVSAEATCDVWRFSIAADDPQSEGLLSRYIFQRQVEIIRELKESS